MFYMQQTLKDIKILAKKLLQKNNLNYKSKLYIII